MKPCRKKDGAISTKQRLQRREKRVYGSLFLHRRKKIFVTLSSLQKRGKCFFTPSDTVILLKRYCKFYYQQGNTGLVDNFNPCFQYAQKYLKKKYSLDHISNRMEWLQKKYFALKKNVEDLNLSFENRYEALIYKWGEVAWGNVPIDAIPTMIDLVKTPMKEKTSEHKGGQKIGKINDESIINVSNSENKMKEYESEDQIKVGKWDKECGDKHEIGENNDAAIVYISDSENEMKTHVSDSIYISDSENEMKAYVSDSEIEMKACESEGQINANRLEKEGDDEWIQSFKDKLAKSLKEFQDSYFRKLQ